MPINICRTLCQSAYLKYSVSRRFVDRQRGSFQYKGSNWFRAPHEMTDRAWKADVALLDQMHRLLRDAVTRLSSGDLRRTPRGKKVSNFALLSGIAAHDLYHAGQIQLLKRLSNR